MSLEGGREEDGGRVEREVGEGGWGREGGREGGMTVINILFLIFF